MTLVSRKNSTSAMSIGFLTGSFVATGIHPGSALPASIPSDEVFFWSSKWQLDELEAAKDLARGEVHSFSSGTEAVRWLLSDDEDEEE